MRSIKQFTLIFISLLFSINSWAAITLTNGYWETSFGGAPGDPSCVVLPEDTCEGFTRMGQNHGMPECANGMQAYWLGSGPCALSMACWGTAEEFGEVSTSYNNSAGQGGAGFRQFYGDNGTAGCFSTSPRLYLSTGTYPDKIWIRYYIRIDADWDDPNGSGWKLAYGHDSSYTANRFLPQQKGTSLRMAYMGDCGGIGETEYTNIFNSMQIGGLWDEQWHYWEWYIDGGSGGGWKFWIDGVLKIEETNCTPFPVGDLSYIMIGHNAGGNPVGQWDNAWVEYDDFAIATVGYTGFVKDANNNDMIGPVSGEIDSTPPVVIISTSDPSNITSNSLPISGTASDANGVDECKYRIGAAPTETQGTLISETTNWYGTATGFSQGANTLYVGCADPSNNWGSHSITVNFWPRAFVGVKIE